jgi:branched-chain amino acid transport system ATP-binding protein
MAILAVEGISKSFGGLQVLQSASLEVAEGTITGLVGPNGSGKTTLLNTIYGLIKPDEGTVIFRGQKISGLAPYRIYDAGLAFSFQLPRLFFQLTVLDNLLLAARNQVGTSFSGALFRRRRWRRQEAELARKALQILELLGLVPLALHATGELSGGQRKLVEIGRALMSDPVMILLDEPAAGVNPVLGRKIYQKLRALRDQGLTFLIIEHKLEMLLDFADRIYMMDAGQVVLSGTPKEVIENPVFYATYVGETKNVTFPG